MGGKKIRLLIAEDHDLLRDAIKKAFEPHDDIEVLPEACDGLEAIRLSTELKPDVVLMDIMMPIVSGIEATKEIRKVSPSTAVLFLTGYDDDRYVIGLLETGAAGYLMKSTHGQRLVRAVRAVYEGEAVIDFKVFRKILKYTTILKNAEDIDCLKNRPVDILSEREVEVLRMASTGMSNKDIAARLCVTVATVKAHLYSIFNKMGVASRTEAIVKGIRDGLVTTGDLYEK